MCFIFSWKLVKCFSSGSKLSVAVSQTRSAYLCCVTVLLVTFSDVIKQNIMLHTCSPNSWPWWKPLKVTTNAHDQYMTTYWKTKLSVQGQNYCLVSILRIEFLLIYFSLLGQYVLGIPRVKSNSQDYVLLVNYYKHREENWYNLLCTKKIKACVLFTFM